MTMPRALKALSARLNPLVVPLARRLPPLALVLHTGRRSGTAYRTPVQAFRTDRGWIIALAYGADVQWVRNVEAAGGAQLVRRGRLHQLSEPRRLHGTAGSSRLPAWSRLLMRLVRVDDFVELAAVEAAPDHSPTRSAAQG
ncbi:MAG TPA: nitroreductase family deazaflavin-dependent oxidoreductase [Jiangellaceae bacterium]